MNLLLAEGCAVAGAIAGVPLAAVTYSVRREGPIHLSVRWWTGAPASRRSIYTVAALCAGATAIVGAFRPANTALLAFWIFAVVGVALAVVDVRCHRLPHLLTSTLLATSGLCFAVAVLTDAPVGFMVRAALAGSISAATLLVISLAAPGQLGLGDVAFAGAIAFNLGWLSWQAAICAAVYGWLLQAALVVIAKITGRSRSPVPLGPALMCGWLLTIVFTT